MSDNIGQNLVDMMAGKTPLEPQTPIEETPVAAPEPAAEPVEETPAEQPAAVEAPITENEPEKGASPDNDYHWLEEIYGAEAKDPATIRATIEKERADKMELEARLRELSEKPAQSFANETVRKFDAFIRETGLEDFSLFQKLERVEVGKDSTIEQLAEAVVTARLLENPDDAPVADKLKKQIIREASMELDEDSTEEEREDAELKRHRLFTEAKKSVEKINEIKGKLVEKAASPQNSEEEKLTKEARVQKWEPLIKEQVKEIKITIPKVAEKDGTIQYLQESLHETTFDSNQKADYEVAFRHFLDAYKMPEPTKEVLEQAHGYAFKEAVFASMPKIIADAVNKARAEEAKKYATEIENPSAVRAEQKVAKGGSDANILGGFIQQITGG